MKTFGVIMASILGIGAIVAVSLLIKVIFFPVHTAQQELNTAYDAVSKTINADNAIYNYEWFKQTHEDIEATKRKLDNASITLDVFKEEAGPRVDWTFEDKTESSRLGTIKLGLQNHLEQIIANYNARAKMANRNIFQNSILPDYLDALTFIRK